MSKENGMQRWNGWGDDRIHPEFPRKGRDLLAERIGSGQPWPDYPMETLMAREPESRLPRHPLISVDPRLRLVHAHGQSLPDWVRMRGATLDRFPDGVGQPTSRQDVEALLEFAAAHDIAVIPYGGGTSVVGHLEVPEIEKPVLSLSFKRLNRMLDIDTASLLATFEAGIRGPDLEAHLNPKGFTLGHYPQSFEYSTLGGWVATRSSGQQSRHYGRIEQLFAGGELLTSRGCLRLPPYPASGAGPDLRHLVLGSEGRLGVLTNVVVRISPLPEKDIIHAVFFPSWDNGKQAVQSLAASGTRFSMVRLSNAAETTTHLALAGHEREIAWLNRYLNFRGISRSDACLCLVGFTGSRQQVASAKAETSSLLRPFKGVSAGTAIGRAWKQNRFRSAYLRNTLWDLGYAVDTLETAVIWPNVNQAVAAIERSLRQALLAWDERVHVFTHLSHVYPTGSSIYATFVFRLAPTPEETLERWRALKQAGSRAVVEAGGTITHQHGIGTDHQPYLAAEKGPVGIAALQHVFSYFDPDRRMNPGKLVPDLSSDYD
jgi:alkyldihydroxyacetonephosphate synthase